MLKKLIIGFTPKLITAAYGLEMNNNYKVKSMTDKSKYFKISHACHLLFSIHKVLNNPQRVVRV